MLNGEPMLKKIATLLCVSALSLAADAADLSPLKFGVGLF